MTSLSLGLMPEWLLPGAIALGKMIRRPVLLALVVALILAGCGSDEASNRGGRRRRILSVRAVTVKKGQVERFVSATGTTFPLAEVKIMPRIEGQISRISVREGSMVKKGDLLVKLDDTIVRHQTALTRAELAAAKARLKKLRAGSLPEEIKRAEATVRQRRESLKRGKAELTSAMARLYEVQSNLKSFENLYKQGVVSSQQRLSWETQVNTAKALGDEKRAKLGEDSSLLTVALEQLTLVKRGARSEDIEVAENDVRRAEANFRLLQARLRTPRHR